MSSMKVVKTVRTAAGIAAGFLSAFIMPCNCQAQIPKLFQQQSFNCDTLADAANHYVAIGEDATIRELSALPPDDYKGIDIDERVGWVCRILFQPKGKHFLREPMLGGLQLPYEFRRSPNWPLYPIAQSGSSYFVLSEGYMLAGFPEPREAYLNYCRTNGRYRTSTVPRPSKSQAESDATTLRQSKNWQVIRWTSRLGYSYGSTENATFAYIKAQADSIPADNLRQ